MASPEPHDGQPSAPPGCRRTFHIAMVALVLGVAALIGGPTMLEAWRERQLLRHGTDALATVVMLEDTRDTVNDRPVVRLTVDVAPEGLEPYRAQIVTPLSPVDLQNYTIGAQIRVRYDPEDPRKLALVGPLPPAPRTGSQ
jgi:hypothetical protein